MFFVIQTRSSASSTIFSAPRVMSLIRLNIGLAVIFFEANFPYPLAERSCQTGVLKLVEVKTRLKILLGRKFSFTFQVSLSYHIYMPSFD